MPTHLNPPAHCDICKQPIRGGFSDAAITIGQRRIWANLCPLCAIDLGARYGTGQGQRYEKDLNGQFHKVEG